MAATPKTPRTYRRQSTLIKKAHELGEFPGVDVALFIRKRGQYTTYISTDDGAFPPTMTQIRKLWPVAKILSANDIEKKWMRRDEQGLK